jgi:hypothetical protein
LQQYEQIIDCVKSQKYHEAYSSLKQINEHMQALDEPVYRNVNTVFRCLNLQILAGIA